MPLNFSTMDRAWSTFCVLLVLVTGVAALIELVPAHISGGSQSERTEQTHLECSALKPSNEIFERHANASQNENTNSRQKRQASVAQPIRITTVYDSSFDALSRRFDLKGLVEQAVSFFKRALLVRRPSSSPLTLSRSCKSAGCKGNCPYDCTAPVLCHRVAVPPQFLDTCNICSTSETVTGTIGGPGAANTDYLLFVSSVSNGCSATTVAYASVCELEARTWRPIAGMLNLCNVTNSQGDLIYDPENTVQLIAHEITHALGFSRTFLSFFVDDSGNTYSTLNPATKLPYKDSSGNYVVSSKVVVTKTVMWQTASGLLPIKKTFIVTPTVVDFVRKYFGCDSLIGAELEDQGSEGTAYSHWEKRIFVNEYMAGVITEQIYISNLTLSLLQDSGWYYAKFSEAQPYTWGKGLGCKFASESCLGWINAKVAAGENPYPFCNTFDYWSTGEIRTMCDPQQQSKRACNLISYAALNPSFTYFSEKIANALSAATPSQYGGYVEHADYCPYYMETSNSYSGYAKAYSTCSNNYHNPVTLYNYASEKYGVSSLCLRQKTPFFFYQCAYSARSVTWGAGCYVVTCTASSVTINVNGQVLTCSSELQAITLSPTATQLNITQFPFTPTIATGTIVCPLCVNACPNSYCPMKSTANTGTELLKTDQTNNAVQIPSKPANTPCYSAPINPAQKNSSSSSSNGFHFSSSFLLLQVSLCL